MEFRAGHTTHCKIHQNMKFLFPLNRHVYRAIALYITTIMPQIHPVLRHAKGRKYPKIHHQRYCQAIYTRHFLVISAGGRASSAVGSMIWEKFVGLRWSFVQVTPRTAIFTKT